MTGMMTGLVTGPVTGPMTGVMKKTVLSKRLQAAADMVTPGNRVCDVGCDHGWVSIYLIEQGISERAIAMDIRRGPLERADQHIRERNLNSYIETRLSDGIKELRAGEADTLIIAGMGGRLMKDIISAEPTKTAKFQELILQPQSEIPEFRRFLRSAGYVVGAEEIVFEDGKYYFLMKVRLDVAKDLPGAAKAQPGVAKDLPGAAKARPDAANVLPAMTGHADAFNQEDRWGGLLLKQRHPVLRQYLCRTLDHHEDIIRKINNGNAAMNAAEKGLELRKHKRIRELQEEVDEIERILSEWA